MSVHNETKRMTITRIREMKDNGEKISVLTAYDFSLARVLDDSGVDILLVGDSAANVMAGYDTTLPITLDQMIYHGASVVRGAKRALVVVDLPFGTYQASPEKAFEAAVRVMKETGAQAVKLEGGVEIKAAVELITQAGIPVMGHLGLTPPISQSVWRLWCACAKSRGSSQTAGRQPGTSAGRLFCVST